jgi:hypothetical protein
MPQGKLITKAAVAAAKAKELAKADSLMQDADSKKSFYSQQEKIANAQLKRGTGDQVQVLDLKGTTTPTAKERLAKAQKKLAEAKRDSTEAANIYKRYGKR